MVILRPGQRHVMIPGDAVTVRAGRNTLHAGGVDWSIWFDHFYDAKNAASQAASYTDLVGSTNLTAPSAPSWSAGTGWTFVSASNQYLATGIVPVATSMIAVRYSEFAVDVAFQSLMSEFEIAASIAGFGFTRANADFIRFGNGGGSDSGKTVSGVLVQAGNKLYRNGEFVATSTGTFSGTAIQFFVGARNLAGVADRFADAVILAVGTSDTTPDAAGVAALSAAMAAL